jgi:hypothetical protein
VTTPSAWCPRSAECVNQMQVYQGRTFDHMLVVGTSARKSPAWSAL